MTMSKSGFDPHRRFGWAFFDSHRLTESTAMHIILSMRANLSPNADRQIVAQGTFPYGETQANNCDLITRNLQSKISHLNLDWRCRAAV